MEGLALSGAFDCFEGVYREQLVGVSDKGESTLDMLMKYGNMYQQDKAQQQNSLFGDLSDGFGVDIHKPELPKPPKMSAIEKLNIEKNLIGIFLSAHPLDEYEFEVTDLCSVTAEELTRFEGWRTPDARNAAPVNAEDEEEEQEVRVDPKEWIAKHENQTLHLGGIVTSAEEAISQKGNPYGRYVIEDYSGSYRLTIFGETYKNCAHMLKLNLYVYLTGIIQQRGANRPWFKPKNMEEAEYEFVAQQVELLKDTQDKHLEMLTLRIPIENVTKELNDELSEQISAHPGRAKLKIQISDASQHNMVTFVAQSHPIRMDKEFYHWLKLKELDGVLSHKIN